MEPKMTAKNQKEFLGVSTIFPDIGAAPDWAIIFLDESFLHAISEVIKEVRRHFLQDCTDKQTACMAV